MNPLVSVIYVNYNTSGLLLQSIRSLISLCRSISFEIIIIDNASNDNEKKQLQKGLADLQQENIRLIFSDENLGFGSANNRGVKQSKGSFLFFLNPDTVILNDVINIFFQFLNTAPSHIAACGGKLLNPDLGPNDSYGNFPSIRQELAMTGLGFRFMMKDYQQNVSIASIIKDDKPRKVPYLVGADIFIRTEIFKLVHGFDENYFLYYEETDLFRKLHEKGFQSFLLPEAHIIHFEGETLKETPEDGFSILKFTYLLNSKLYYYQKWYPAKKLAFIKFIVLIQILAQFIKGKMGNELKPLLKVYFNSKVTGLSATQTSPDSDKKP